MQKEEEDGKKSCSLECMYWNAHLCLLLEGPLPRENISSGELLVQIAI